MPKFKLEMSFGLSEALTAMGMPDLFEGDKADLSNITVDERLYVSAVIHKAFVEVCFRLSFGFATIHELAGEREG